MLSTDRSPAPAILVVEDDRLFRSLAVETLHSEGYAASGVGSAAEALIRLAEVPDVALLVTDINMPGMSGLELVRLVKASSPAMRVLVISGRERVDEDTLPTLAEFMQKPFSAQHFVARVRDMLGR